MKIPYNSKFALVVYRGNAEIVRVRKDRGPGYTFFMQNDIDSFADYDERIDAYTTGPSSGVYIKTLHVVAAAARADALPQIGTVAVPDKDELRRGLLQIKVALVDSNLSRQMQDYLTLMLEEENRATIAFPRLADANGDSLEALKLALNKLTEWEKALFSGIADRVGSTINRAAPEVGDFAARVREAAASAPTASVLTEDSQEKCMADLQKLLDETVEKIAAIDRRLTSCGPAPAWRDHMNEVSHAATQVNRTLDFVNQARATTRRPGL